MKWFKDTWNWLKKFFLNYLWIGIALLLLSIILDLNYPTVTRNYATTVGIKLIEATGLSIFIAAIFTFASGTSDFVNKIRIFLEDIIVRRNFLANIDAEGKKEALKALIQPSVSEKNKYPNIGDYYGYFINRLLDVGKKSVRSNYYANSRAYFDSTKQKIAVESTYSYRLYPSSEGFINPITVGFEDEESFCSCVSINKPNGDRKSFDNPELKKVNANGDISYVAEIPIKDFCDGENHIDVDLRITEYGSDHWKLLQFKALQPTDGFKFFVHCDGELVVKTLAIFVVGAKYHVELPDDKKSVMISCNQWVNEGTGLCVLVSIPQEELTDLSQIVNPNETTA